LQRPLCLTLRPILIMELIHPVDLPEVAERLADLLSESVKKAGTRIDYIFERIASARSQLWMSEDGVIITEISQRASERVLWVDWLISGSFDPHKADELLTSFAAKKGCSAIEFKGRRGWQKYEKGFEEYKPIATIYRRTV